MADNRILAKIARNKGTNLLSTAIDVLLPVDAAKSGRTTLLGGIVGAVAVRVATRSVPGAILVGGAVVAKRLYDRKRSRREDLAKGAQKAAPKA